MQHEGFTLGELIYLRVGCAVLYSYGVYGLKTIDPDLLDQPQAILHKHVLLFPYVATCIWSCHISHFTHSLPLFSLFVSSLHYSATFSTAALLSPKENF